MPLLAAIDWHSVFFYLFALVTCFFALCVLFSNNIVRMAFYLVLSLGATSGLFFLAGAEFVGAMQLLIYVGGTLVLLIFGVMLTAQKSFITMKTRTGDWILAAMVGGALLLLLLYSTANVPSWRTPRTDRDQLTQADTEDTARIGAALIGERVDRLDADAPEDGREAGMSGYLLPFEIISVHLLVVLIGAAYLARARRRAAPDSASLRGQPGTP